MRIGHGCVEVGPYGGCRCPDGQVQLYLCNSDVKSQSRAVSDSVLCTQADTAVLAWAPIRNVLAVATPTHLFALASGDVVCVHHNLHIGFLPYL